MISEQVNSSTSAPADIFATTHWTVVLAAGQKRTPQSDQALEERSHGPGGGPGPRGGAERLARTYWYPLYAYIRRRGYSKEDAEDLTQAFFERFLGKNYLDGLNADRGRFRAFLLASLKHFLANEWDRSQRQKRGGNATHFSLNWQTADTQFQVAARVVSPDAEFDREWAIALLEKVISRLEDECRREGRGEQFAKLRPFLTAGKGAIAYAEVAQSSGMDEGAIRVAVHRLRKRYRQLLADEIAQTLSDGANVEDEMRSLFTAFAR